MKRRIIIILIIVTILSTIGLYYQENLYLQKILRHANSRQILQTKYSSGEIENDNKISNEVSDVIIDSEDTDAILDKFIPENVPSFYLHDTKQLHESYNKTCAPFPELFNLDYGNEYWQILETRNGTFQLWNAFLDNRTLNEHGATIRIIAMINQFKPDIETFCQIRFNDTKKPLIVPTDEYFFIWHLGWGTGKPKMYRPYIISCHIPKQFQDLVPVSVSLVEQACDKPTNSLKVVYNAPEDKRRDFAVCVKGLNFPYEDKMLRLAEWIELLNLLGADKVFFYEFQVHPNVRKLLDYYIDKGIIEVNPLTLVGNGPNSAYLENLYLQKRTFERRFQEVIPYNDCFYKNMYRYRYIVLLDIDEVIVPAEDTWHELINHLEKNDAKKKPATAYVARNVYFLDSHQHDHDWFTDIPRYMHMLQHVHRSMNYTKPGFYIKCFHNTDRVMALHNHYPRGCLGGKPCNNIPIQTNLAHMQHYRSDCVRDLGSSCESLKNNSVIDTRVWNFKNQLIDRVRRTLLDLGVLRKIQ